MAAKRKTWQEKLADKENLPKILELERRFSCYNAVHKRGAEVGEEIVLVNPSEVVEVMKKVPYGRCTTIVEICQYLAKKHKVKGCCSLTTGIFIMTAANAAEEARGENRDLEVPYWRTLKAAGYLNEKFPAAIQKAQLEKEGFKIAKEGKRFYVENYEQYLVRDF